MWALAMGNPSLTQYLLPLGLGPSLCHAACDQLVKGNTPPPPPAFIRASFNPACLAPFFRLGDFYGSW